MFKKTKIVTEPACLRDDYLRLGRFPGSALLTQNRSCNHRDVPKSLVYILILRNHLFLDEISPSQPVFYEWFATELVDTKFGRPR